jgi:hypothetical protein
MKEQQSAEAVVETVPEDPSRPDGATDIYLIFDGRRIAKRGKPGTLHAMTWISLEPGVVVRDVPMPESELEVSTRGRRSVPPHARRQGSCWQSLVRIKSSDAESGTAARP